MTASAAQQARELTRNFFPPEKRSEHSVESLASILGNFVGAVDLPTRLDAFVELKEWTVSRSSSPVGKEVTRLETVLALMESQSELRVQFQQGVREILTEVRSVELFAEAGLHPREGLWSEALRRLMEELLPSAREDTDLSKLVFRIYPTSEAIDRLIALPDDTFERMARMISPVNDASAWAKQREDLTQAFHLLGVHAAGIGLSPGLRARSHPWTIEESPFYQLQQATGELARQHGAALALESWRSKVQRCRDEMEYVHQRMEDTGVNTSLVFDMGTIERAIARMERIAEVLFVAEQPHLVAAVKSLLDDVMNARRDDMSLRALFRENSALIARKVVERTGKTGEHYIANSRREYRDLWKASLGGGLLTVVTAADKDAHRRSTFSSFRGRNGGGDKLCRQFHCVAAPSPRARHQAAVRNRGNYCRDCTHRTGPGPAGEGCGVHQPDYPQPTGIRRWKPAGGVPRMHRYSPTCGSWSFRGRTWKLQAPSMSTKP